MNRREVLAGQRLDYAKAARADWLRAWWVPALATVFVVLSSGFIAGVLWWSFSNWNVTEAVRAAAIVGALAFLGSSAIAWPWWARKIDAADKAIQETHYMHWESNPSPHREWVLKVDSHTSRQHRSASFRANESQIQEIARRVKAGRYITVAEIKDIFRNNVTSASNFEHDLIAAEMGEWKSETAHNLGLVLNQLGRDWLFSHLDNPLPQVRETLEYTENGGYTEDIE